MQKPSPFRYLLLIIPVAIIVVLAYFVRQQMAHIAGIETVAPTSQALTTEGPGNIDPGIQKSVDEAVALLKQQDPGFTLYNVKIDNVIYSEDKSTVEIWLAPIDPETGEVLGREPDIAVAKRNPDGQKGEASEWSVTLPFNESYDEVVKTIPEGLLGEDFKQRFQTKYPEEKTAAKFGGYYLPWAGGQKKRVTWSISHTSCSGNACYYAFDFADGTMFPILAAKGGTVFATQTSCNNGSTGCTNYIILKDNSTTPTSYQVYYHLAKDSTPAELRKVGAVVKQGQFIGNVDDTGASTAHHLHFMVHTNSYGYWGNSVDITFRDVSINYDSTTKGGRPRTLTEASKYGGQGQTYYTSGNSSSSVPTGSITSPAEGSVITSRTLNVTASGSDDRGLSKGMLLVYYDNAWHESVTATPSGNTFNFSLDMCSAGIPDGPISLALRVWDVEGNQTTGLLGLRGVVKNYRCSAATVTHICEPAANQIALYTGTYYSGTCKVYSAGDYATMSGISASDAASVLVGSGAQISMWTSASYKGRSETLVTSDPDLFDNLLNRDTLGSFKVKSTTNAVAAPVINYPTSSTTVTSDTTVTASWYDGSYTNEFQAELSGTNGFSTVTRDWSRTNSWNVGSLPAGTYTLKVRGRNSVSLKVSSYTTVSFKVTAASVSNTAAETAPWMEDFESGSTGWASTGLWMQTTARSISSSHSWFYGEVSDNAFRYGNGTRGTLTSPVIAIPSGGYYVHFFYRYNTESTAKYWDQRWLQVSVDGGPFNNLYQFSSDPRNTWLQSPAISLNTYAGHNIRLRFSFDTLDTLLNVGEGWYIDNVLINQNGPLSSCLEASSNDTPATAGSIAVGSPVGGDICPGGDVDYYKFTANAGDRLSFDIEAKTIGSDLDTVLSLVNIDGATVLAENDDEVSSSLKDSYIYYTMPAAGTYYLRVQAWNHPLAEGKNNFYVLRMYNDLTSPVASIAYPTSGTLVPNGTFNITVNASDIGSGVGHVVFYWHNHDWNSGVWTKLGEDWSSADGWRYAFNPTTSAGKGGQGAIYAQVFDQSGNYTGASSWNISTDPAQAAPAVPTSDIIAFASANSNLNTVLIQWNANDVGNGIAAFEFQIQENGGSWSTWVPEGVSAASRSAWFIGQMGKTYGFRMRVIDAAGSAEAWPADAEATVTLNGCTSGVDVSENDNNLASAKTNVIGGDHVAHTFCGQNDEDWIKFSATAGEVYFINTIPSNLAEAAVLTLYDAAGHPLAESFPTQLGSPNTLRWTAPATADFYVKARNFNPLIAGDGAVYQMWITQGNITYVPMVTQ